MLISDPNTGYWIDSETGKQIYPDELEEYYKTHGYGDGTGGNSESQTKPEETQKPKKPDMYLSLYANNKNDGLWKTKLLNNNGYVVASKKGDKLYLNYATGGWTCTDKIDANGNRCNTRIEEKDFSVWEPETYDEAMLTANLVDLKDSLKGKTFIEKGDNKVGENYTYKLFSENGFNGTSDLQYWGNNLFWFGSTLTGEDLASVVSEQNGKYYLVMKNNNKVYNFKEAAEGKTQDYSEFSYTDSNGSVTEIWVAVDKTIAFNKYLYEGADFKGSTYKYRKDYISNKGWAVQAAIWKDAEGNKLECTGYSATRNILISYGSTEMQTYSVTLDNKTAEVKNIIKADSGEKEFLLLDDRYVTLEDKKDGTVVITDGDKTYTLKYDSRYGYDAANFVEVDLTSAKKVEFNAFDKTDSKYKLLKTMTVADVLDLYKTYASESKQKKGYDYIAYQSNGGAPVANNTKIEDLNPKTLYLAYAKLNSAISITLKYAGNNFTIIDDANTGFECTASSTGDSATVLVGQNTTGKDLLILFASNGSDDFYSPVVTTSGIKLKYGKDNVNTLTSDKTIKEAGLKDGDTITAIDFDASQATYKFKFILSDSALNKQLAFNSNGYYGFNNFTVSEGGDYATFDLEGNTFIGTITNCFLSSHDKYKYGIIVYNKNVVYSNTPQWYYAGGEGYNGTKISEYDFDSDGGVNEITYYCVEDYAGLRTILGLTETEFPVYKLKFEFDDEAKTFYTKYLTDETKAVLDASEYEICDKSDLLNIMNSILYDLEGKVEYSKKDNDFNTDCDLYFNGKQVYTSNQSWDSQIKKLLAGTLDGIKRDGTDTIVIKRTQKSNGSFTSPDDTGSEEESEEPVNSNPGYSEYPGYGYGY